MNNARNYFLAAVVLAVVLLGFGAVIKANRHPAPRPTGATLAPVNRYEAGVFWFGNGLYVGPTQQFSIDASGNLSTTGTFSATGAITGSAAATVGLFTQGGGIIASSTTATTGTLQSTDVDTENVFDFTANTGDSTLTLAASTTALCPASAGQTRTYFIRNATTSATTDITVAGGTGMILKRATSTVGSIILGDTDASNYAKLDITKKANTDCVALMTLYND